ncbi:similar to Saccharomyces cerevisiae YGR264C MES1 Methionyl-tRNA synthetase [Maudiozyma barnettii]|uniref:methionine--tRNA ligase n=1 Tax=Maudiozyma barnettii TaxID=61262 RepID=A0A8H2VIL1_9SACH|nr:methionine--tRNA ligase MES1 [Kazachstania barnettii]CAB4256137.1 similar to Saccharomyces cerevisiae YGR264C MES1 Methionyl-tRNA synthetase [Kazachstania barnettii]CAD1784745.1 similar to Saccharomyces cerevisiae YGR264C MES1 Methionyl-tRNA synthetase [Kazachstania barnettii]
MVAQVSFEKENGFSSYFNYSSNLKVALAIEYATKDLKIQINDDLKTVQFVDQIQGQEFTLFNANAILCYAMNDFTGQDSEEFHFSESSLESFFRQQEVPQEHATVCVQKTLDNYLTSLEEPMTSLKLITFVNAFTLDPEQIIARFPTFPEKIKNAIVLAAKHTPRSSKNFKHTGTSKIATGFEVAVQSEEILPKDGERNIIITSALPYVNNVPHLGNIVGSVLSADIFARYCKSRNYNTLFVCGTDEYGTATETKALEEGVTPRKLCNKYHAIHKDVYDWFQIGFDHFGRTTTPQQTEIAQNIFTELNDNGFLEEQSMKQLYCEEHNSYLADRFVEGECPKCHYDDARGDQCDKCGALLDPFELINPRCKLDNSTPVIKNTDHIFLSLDKLEDDIKEWFLKASEEGQWSKNSKTITSSWLKEGLNPRCITRDLIWGTPVPLEKYKDKVLYVWFDATIGYVSITANYTKNWEQWWKNPENVKLYQFMGKDNVPFHTVVFPGSQIGTKENWTMLHHLNTTEYLQYEGGKFSKSRNVGVFGNNAQETGVSPSVWRYYLASIRPESSDSQFSWDDFVSSNNNELLANLGNLVNRLVKFVDAKYNGVVPKYDPKEISNFDELSSNINTILSSYINEMELAHERRGLEIAMSLSARGNQFLQENKLDNSLFSELPKKSDAVVGVGLNIIYAVASLIYPFMPETSNTIYKILNAPALKISNEFNLVIQGEHNINKPEYLFKRIDPKQVETWRSQYGGQSKE